MLGASGYAGAIAAMLVHRHPFFELAHVTARSEAGARLDDLHPRTRVPLELEHVGRRSVQSDVDAALVCWPHGVAAPAVAALRERGVRVVDLSADFRLRDRGIYEDWYGEHGAPGAVRRRASTGCPSCTASGSPAPTSSPTPAATRPPRCSRSRRSRAPG